MQEANSLSPQFEGFSLSNFYEPVRVRKRCPALGAHYQNLPQARKPKAM
jgi:hypothetical protein